MVYRTKTYLAGEWTGDSDAIEKLYQWNEGDKWSLHFVDAHANRQCYDTSKPCTIKDSLRDRMNRSKIFVLIVGSLTATARKGSCVYQDCINKEYNYFSSQFYCRVGKAYSTQSFIEYECQLAYNAYLKGEMKIVVLYNSVRVDKRKCPKILQNIGNHVPMKCWKDGFLGNRYIDWDYPSVKTAII